MDLLSRTTRDLDHIERRIGTLVKELEELREKNRSLLSRQESLVAERAQLVKRNEEARSRVEAMINRLKTLEGAV